MTETSRTEAILKAVTKQLQERRGVLDRASDLGQLTITIRLNVGTTVVRAVGVAEERIMGRQS